MSGVYANLTTAEETSGLSGETTVVFPWPIKQLTIMNDGPNDLKWKFKDSHDWATLKTDETIAMGVSVTQIILESSNAKYRVWGVG